MSNKTCEPLGGATAQTEHLIHLFIYLFMLLSLLLHLCLFIMLILTAKVKAAERNERLFYNKQTH